jgi:hypothetical protein
MIFLIIVPIFTTILGLLIYKFQGKAREFLRLDLVQFVYLFLMAPTLFVWLKAFLFYLLRNEVEPSLSVTQIFMVDTVFTVIAIFVMSAIAIHSLTKTFWIKRHHDPQFDLYHLSEYFHLWWSHIIIWGGAMLLFSFVALANVFAPLTLELSKGVFIFIQSLGSVAGAILFLAIWMSDPGQGQFMRLMKLLLVFFFVIHIVFYFVFDPRFNANYLMYWFSLSTFVSAAVIGSIFERYEKLGWFRKIMLHAGWGENKGIDLFKKK